MSRKHASVVLIVGMAIVLTLLGASAIDQAREREAAAECRNNLKQLALSVHSFNDYSQRLPPLVGSRGGKFLNDEVMSLFAWLCPMIEAYPTRYIPQRSPPFDYHAPSSSVVTSYQKGTTFTHTGGEANQVLRMFLDPADATGHELRDVPMTLPDGTKGYYATGSYAANGLIPWGNGRLSDLLTVHGYAHTILFAERPQRCETASGDIVYNLWGLGFYSRHMPAFAALTPSDLPEMASTGQVAPVTPLPPVGAPDRNAQIQVRVGRADAVPSPPDFRTPVQMLRGSKFCDPRLPGTPHLVGLQAAMVDGSVRTFSPKTEPWIFWTACIPGGGATER